MFQQPKTTHQRVSLNHALDAYGERDGDYRGQRFGNNGDRERDAEDEHFYERLAAKEPDRDDNSDDYDGHARKLMTTLSRFNGKGVLPVSTASSIRAILPNSVVIAVAVTTPRPRP